MKNKLLFSLITFTTLFIMSCKQDLNDLSNETNNASNVKLVGLGIMEISYDMKTIRDYETDFSILSELDLSSVNPSEEKQHVEMVLLESGQLNLTITELNFDKKINIPHEILPDDSPKIMKTEIIGNTANFYDINGKLLGSENIPIPNHRETVDKIKEIGNKFSAEDINKTIATMQGYQFIDNLEEFIRNAPANGVQVLEQGENYVSLRMSFNKIDPRIQGASVLLIDKSINKMVGTRIYDAQDNLVQSVFFGYNKGDVQSLSAIRIEQQTHLPSGSEVKMISISQIENLKFNLNIK
ncbi:MAG: hypothetical protein U1C46_09250 [Bacteroidales bacterium]|nr:hypothetical protein [Bacteroidales bacterium]MDZ4204989.1 hypothetical protein [Bacteroidales bacterium]